MSQTIRSDVDKEMIMTLLDTACKRNTTQHAMRAFSINDDRIRALTGKQPHVIAPMYEQSTMVLFFTRFKNFSGACILIQRQRHKRGMDQKHWYPNMSFVKLSMGESLFDGTVVTGEMSRNTDGRSTFEIADVFAYCGERSWQQPFAARMSHASTIVRMYHPDAYDPFDLSIKQYVPAVHLKQHLAEWGGKRQLASLLFKPVSLDAFSGFSVRTTLNRRSKAKQGDNDNTANPAPVADADGDGEVGRTFWVRFTGKPDVYEMYNTKSDAFQRIKPVDTVCVPSMDMSNRLREVFKAKPMYARPLRLVLSERFNKFVLAG